jgi:AraC-like DNA-binding protein
LWLGTEEGTVLSFQPKTDEWKDFGGICGTNGDQVNQVLVDVFNHVWIDMNQKIIEFNPRNGSFRTYLTTDEGMLLWRLIPTAICKGKDGSIYFGGIPGICSVTPSNRLESGAHPIKTFITNVTSMGHSFMFGEKTKEGGSLSAIVLEPDDRYIKIYFSSLNHRFAHKIRYAYRLKGVDRDWVYTANGANSAFYNQIPKGDHLFQVKATDENGLWSDEVTEFTIHRLPAFYETWWAYLIYITAIVCLLLAVLSWYAKKIKRKSNEMWADSAEMMKIRGYLDSEVNLPDAESAQLDKLLLDKAIKTVEGHLTEPDFDVTALAEAMNMSRSTLTRKLKTITGRTPLEFIRNIKMKHACRLLEDKSRSVSEVSVALGYFNRKYFTACFKEEFGMTPSEYQKSLS